MSKARRLLQLDDAIENKDAFRMCTRKTKFKSSQANFHAAKHGQRKYLCPICSHWHLTKQVLK